MHELDGLDPRWRAWAIWLVQQSREAEITSTFRSVTMQRKLYRRFLNGQHPFPVLPPGSSQHEKGLAVDLWAAEAELSRLGAIWRKAGGIWGGAQDPIHFEPGPAMLRRSPPT